MLKIQNSNIQPVHLNVTNGKFSIYIEKNDKNEFELLKVDNYFKNTIKNIFEYSKLKFTFAFLK